VPSDFTSFSTYKPGPLVLSLLNETSGRRVDVTEVADTPRRLMGASDLDPIAVDRFDAAGNVHLWFGPPDNLRPAPDGVGAIVGFDETGAFTSTSPGGLTAAPLEIRHLPFDGENAAVVVTA